MLLGGWLQLGWSFSLLSKDESLKPFRGIYVVIGLKTSIYP